MRERLAFEREMDLLAPDDGLVEERAHESAAGVRRKLLNLSLLPHWMRSGGAEVEVSPALVDPKFHDGPEKYRITQGLQDRLMAVMRRREFRHIAVALVDMTGKVAAPDFAGYFHKDQRFDASVAKLTTMLAAFQLRHDLRVAAAKKSPKTLADLFAAVRDDWAATQRDPGGKPVAFSRGVQLRGKLVLLRGGKVALKEPKAPRLETVFAPVAAGGPVTVEFSRTGESLNELESLVDRFNLTTVKEALASAAAELAQAKRSRDAARIRAAQTTLAEAKRKHAEAARNRPAVHRKITALGFRERLGIAVGGDVPASNVAVATVVRDIGFLYMASTVLQTGLYDTNRGGGMWLGADFSGSVWRGAPAGGSAQSGNAAALASFLTLLRQGTLVSPDASREMREMMQKRPAMTFPGTGSWFDEGLGLPLRLLLAKVGLFNGADEIALIERDVEKRVRNPDGTTTTTTTRICYAVAALRARHGGELRALIRELDKCILANNALTP